MNEKLYEALEICLNDLEAGADLGSVLMRYPEMADELRPLLEASIAARSLGSYQVPVPAMRRGRARVLQHAAEMREAGQKPRWFGIAFRRLATALALASVFFLSGTGLVRASNGALPGDNLYPVKRTWEGVQLVFVVNPESREELENEFELERLEEVDELLGAKKYQSISFTGTVIGQNGDKWSVSGIPVQIVPSSHLPVDPINVGTFISVLGHTNAQGFVEVDRIEILAASFLTPVPPAEYEGKLEAERHDGLELEEIEKSEGNDAEGEGSEGEALSGDNSEGESISNLDGEGGGEGEDGNKENTDAESSDSESIKADGSDSESNDKESSKDNGEGDSHDGGDSGEDSGGEVGD